MKLELRFFKQTGKWNYDTIVDVPDDITNYDGWVRNHVQHTDCYVFVSVIEPDGHKQPVRLVDFTNY